MLGKGLQNMGLKMKTKLAKDLLGYMIFLCPYRGGRKIAYSGLKSQII